MAVDHPRPAAARRIQQREIAARAGVSVSTVSRVLNNVAGISETVQQRVLAAAAELGYERNEAKPATRIQNVSLLTSLPLAPSLDPFHADLLSGVELACGREGLHLNYATFVNGSSNAEMVLERLRQNPVDGLLLLSIDDPALIEQIRAMGRRNRHDQRGSSRAAARYFPAGQSSGGAAGHAPPDRPRASAHSAHHLVRAAHDSTPF